MENFEVSLIKYLCPVCGNIAEEGIIMNSLLSEKAAKEVKNLHGKTIGYSDHACKECLEYKDKVVFFIGIDISKSEKDNPYRTGHITGVKKDSQLVNQCSEFILKLKDGSQYCFIDYNIGKQIGLWN